jgi:hypothetical protein
MKCIKDSGINVDLFINKELDIPKAIYPYKYQTIEMESVTPFSKFFKS